MSILFCEPITNVAVSLTGDTFEGNSNFDNITRYSTQSAGGALYLTLWNGAVDSSLEFADLTFTGNSNMNKMTVESGLGNLTSKTSGGAICINVASSIGLRTSFSNCTFVNNSNSVHASGQPSASGYTLEVSLWDEHN